MSASNAVPSADRTVLVRLREALSRHRVAATAIVALAVAAVVLGVWLLSGNGSVRYVLKPVEVGTISRSVSATGAVNPVLTVTVGTYVSGVITGIYCDFNTHVRKGQLCAKIDVRPYQTQVDQDAAGLATANAQLLKDMANLAYARVTRTRYASLYASHATSNDLLDSAINTYEQAVAQIAFDKAQIAQRQAALETAQVNLGYTNIVSPVDGTVVSRNVTVGQTVAASFQTPTLFLIATDLAKMEVDTNVSESDVGVVRVGQAARFTVEAFPDHTFTGVVDQVRQAPQTVQNVVTYDVVIKAANPDLLLKPGMTATVRIVTQERRGVLRVPSLALRYAPGGLSAGGAQDAGSQLWLLRDGRPQGIGVTTGLDDDKFTEITSGRVRAGDQVIVSEKQSDTASARTVTNGPRF